MLSENEKNEQTTTDEIKVGDHLETFSHELSETEPTFVVIGANEIKINLLVKQNIESKRIFELESLLSSIRQDKDTTSPWRMFLNSRKSGLLVILYSDDEGYITETNQRQKNENKATEFYNLMVKCGLTSVYLWNCNFGVPKFDTPTDKSSLERGLKDAYSKIHSVGVSLNEFDTRLELTRNEPPISTGYDRLDEILDGGIYPGLYLFGADTSLGKSTFWLNVAVNASNKGRSVLYFSIEMSSFELKGRMLSRETYLLSHGAKESGHPQTSRTLTNWFKFDRLSEVDKALYKNARTMFEHKSRNLYLYENIGELYAETIQSEVVNFMTRTGTTQPPLVIVDYIQILRHKDNYVDANDKLKLDKNLFFLKKMSNDFRLPLVCISSLNRDSYKNYQRITMTSFKESGAVEYTADVLIGMQLEKLARDGSLTQEQAEQELSNDVREIDLVILKNRQGTRSIHTHFKYHTWFNDFSEVPGFDRYPNKNDVTRGYTGQPVTVPDDDQDDDQVTFLE